MSTIFDKVLWQHAWDNGEPRQSLHAAAISLNGIIVAIGHNRNKTHPLQQRFCRHEEAIKLHAEIDVIVKFLRNHNAHELKEAKLYIARVRWNSKRTKKMWGTSAPCEGCRRAIEAFNIPYVEYTILSPFEQVETEILQIET